MPLSTPVKLLAAAAMLGMLPLAAAPVAADTPDTQRRLEDLEGRIEQLLIKQAELDGANRGLRAEVQALNVRLAALDSRIGTQARDFLIGGENVNKTITMRLGQFDKTSVVLDGKTATITADNILLKGKIIRIDAATLLTLNGETVDVTGNKVNVKGSAPLPIKGGKVLGN